MGYKQKRVEDVGVDDIIVGIGARYTVTHVDRIEEENTMSFGLRDLDTNAPTSFEAPFGGTVNTEVADDAPHV